MAKRTYRIKTTSRTIPIRVTFGVAAAFEDETGVSIYAGDLSWMRSPRQLVRFLHLAAVAADEDAANISETDLLDDLEADQFLPIVNTVTEAITGRKPQDVTNDAGDGDPGKD
jgi:hypothetical protein